MEEETDKNQLKIVENINDFLTPEQENQIKLEKNRAEEEFQATQKRILFKKKAVKYFSIAVIIALVFAAAFFLYFQDKNNQVVSIQKKEVKIAIPETREHVIINENEATDGSKISDEAEEGFSGISENYRLRDISIGGGSVVLAAQDDAAAVKVSDVRTETLMSKDGGNIKLLISWNTNKPARSVVKYVKQGTSSEKTIKESGYGFSHALVLNKLDQATRYTLKVEVTDRTGNKSASETLAAFTGSKPASVFDLISTQMNDIFGWALHN